VDILSLKKCAFLNWNERMKLLLIYNFRKNKLYRWRLKLCYPFDFSINKDFNIIDIGYHHTSNFSAFYGVGIGVLLKFSIGAH
jgi:hypothetical protein